MEAAVEAPPAMLSSWRKARSDVEVEVRVRGRATTRQIGQDYHLSHGHLSHGHLSHGRAIADAVQARVRLRPWRYRPD